MITAHFELGSAGSQVLVADTRNATAWDSKTQPGANNLSYNAIAAHGSLSMRAVSTDGSQATISWTTALGTVTDHYGRLYFYQTANPASFNDIFQMLSGGSTGLVCAITSAGKIAVADQGGSVVATSTNSITLSAWIRIEYHIIHSATVGQIEIKFFNSAESSTPTETLTTAANKNFLASADEIRYGVRGGQSVATYYYDDIIAGATSYPGPFGAVDMTPCSADFDLGTNGSAIAITDPGSATAWDVRVINVGGALTYSNAHAISGTLSGKFGVAGSSGGNWLEWTTALGVITDHYGRLYIWVDALDADRHIFLNFKTAASAGACGLWINSSGTMSIVDNVNSQVGTTAATVSVGQWVRVEWHFIHSATVGQAELKLFNTANSTTPTEVVTTAANKNFAADARECWLGWVGGPGTIGNIFYLDNIIAGASSYQGPAFTGGTSTTLMGALGF